MSDPEVPQDEQPGDVDDVVGRANEGLDAAAAARGEVPADRQAETADADLAAFEAAERDYPGTFGASDQDARPADAAHEPATDEPATISSAAAAEDLTREEDSQLTAQDDSARITTADTTRAIEVEEIPEPDAAPTVAHTAYTPEVDASAAETRVVPAEPVAPPPAAAPQPIFVQAPEPPRELGNRGAAGAIGLVATLCFAILYLGAILGFGALRGDVTTANIGDAALAPLTTWSFWVPVATFFLAFWLLGAFINRARWGKWVILGVLVAAATYGGHLLGQLFQAPFWRITATESAQLVNEQMLAPLAIAAFVFARELTIWFGAWVARSGARKKKLNAEAQAEYERTLEAGPAALR